MKTFCPAIPFLKISITMLFLLSLTPPVVAQRADYKTMVLRYIVRYREIAVHEMAVSKIPASITLAQGILESNAGQSPLAVQANNHFGIKCHKDWTGETMYKDDDRPNECFRKYSSAEQCFRDHSSFLVERDRYKSLFHLGITDYAGWALGLKNAGYATNPAYAGQLIKTIETYKLFRFDSGDFGKAFADSLAMNGGEISSNPWVSHFSLAEMAPDGHQVYINNGLRLVLAGKEDNLARLSSAFNISIRKLMKFNDLNDSNLHPGQIIYLHAKRRKAAHATHVVQSGETLARIAQGYGIKLKMLYKRNPLSENAEPLPGTRLRLR